METKYISHTAVGQYEFVECHSNKLEDVINTHNSMSVNKIADSSNDYVEVKTWNDKVILYNDAAHSYKDKDGNLLLSGSAYGKTLGKDFPRDMIAEKSAKKHSITPTEVIDQWEMSGALSRDYGSSQHLAMEYYFTHRDKGCFKLPNHKLIQKMVKSCPVYGDERQAFTEAMVAELNLKWCGVIDLILVNEDNSLSLYDYKFSYDIKKSLPSYFGQLQFYATLLEADGFTVKDMTLLNYTDDEEWEAIPVEKKTIIINTPANE